MRRRMGGGWCQVLWTAVLLLAAATTVWSAPYDQAVLAPLLAWAEALPGAVGAFEQSEERADAKVRRLTGRFAFRKPLSFRWEIVSPFVQVTVSDGHTLLTWDPELRQATRAPLSVAVLEGGALGFLLVPQRLSEHFVLIARETEGEVTRWVLRARHADAVVQELHVALAGERLSAVTLVDALGQRSVFRFTAFERRVPGEEAFVVALPAEAPVVDLAGGTAGAERR